MTENVNYNNLPEAVQKLSAKLDSVLSMLEQPTPTHQPDPQGEVFTTKEAADFLNIKIPTLYGYVSKRLIANCKKGKKLYFLKSDLIEFVKSGRQKTASEIETEADNNLIKRNKNGAK